MGRSKASTPPQLATVPFAWCAVFARSPATSQRAPYCTFNKKRSPARSPFSSLERRSFLFRVFLSLSSPSLAPLLLLLRSHRRRRRNPLQVLHLALKLAPVLQLHDAPSGVGVEPRHDAPLPVQLGLGLEAVQLDASANGNGRGEG